MEIQYRLELMEETGFCYKPDYDYNNLELNTLNYQFSHNLAPNVEKEEIALSLSVEITSNNSNDVLAKESIYAVFKLTPFDRVIKVKDKGFKTTEPLLIDTFISITIGALRGMLVKNLKGTPLARSILPLIPMDVIRQNTASLKETE